MFNAAIFLYQTIIGLYVLAVPLVLLLGVVWVLIKVTKKFARSILK